MSLPHPLDQPELYASVMPKRLLAWGVDVAATMILAIMGIVATFGVGLFLFPLLWVGLSVAYRWVMLTRYGATLGMLLASIRLRRLDGGRPSSIECLWHSAIYSGGMITVFPQIASVALMLTSPYKQGLNDLVMQTTIVNRYIES